MFPLSFHQLKPKSVLPTVPLRSCLVTHFYDLLSLQLVYSFLKVLYLKKKEKRCLPSPSSSRINAFWACLWHCSWYFPDLHSQVLPHCCVVTFGLQSPIPFLLQYPPKPSTASQQQNQLFHRLCLCIWFALFAHGALHFPLLTFTLQIWGRLSNLLASLWIWMLSSERLATLPITLPMCSLCSVTHLC